MGPIAAIRAKVHTAALSHTKKIKNSESLLSPEWGIQGLPAEGLLLGAKRPLRIDIGWQN